MQTIHFQSHVSIHRGRIYNNSPSGSATGKLAKRFSTPAFL